MKEELKDIVAQILTELEVDSFVMGQLDCDIEAEYDPSKVSQDLYEKHNKNPPIIIYSEDKDYLTSVQQALESLFPKVNIPIESKTFFIEEIPDQNWRESWKQSFKPVLVQNLFAILPPWENINNFSQKHKIIINPGMAFGTGQHETTRLCLEIMSTYPVSARFLDVGTGSGILALAAKMLGAQFVLGNDIDPDCMPIAQENAKKNGVQGVTFTNCPVAQIQENNFHMIVANIQARPLKTLVPEILKRVSPNGIVILSGILVEEKNDFVEFLMQNNARVLDTKDLNHWCGIVCKQG